MPYPEFFVAPMREDLVRLGLEELRTASDVDAAVTGTSGTLMVFVNSVCGCAAGKARPGLALALRHGVRPDRLTSVFAGFDIDATTRARKSLQGRAALVALNRHPARRRDGLHPGAPPDRKPHGRTDRRRAQSSVSGTLRGRGRTGRTVNRSWKVGKYGSWEVGK